jgi:TatD DNase family protein
MPLIDSHCHLAIKEFQNDLDDVVLRAKEKNVIDFITVGTSPEDWEETRKIAFQYKMRSAFALSPHDAKLWNTETEKELAGFLKSQGTSAVGETGLDYHYYLSSREQQISSFEGHVRLAEELGLPLIIHSRDSFQDTVSMLKNVKVPVIIHCFTYGVKEAESFLGEGFFLSFSGIATFNSADEIREAAKIAPMDRILVETDSPYLAPAPFRGKRCEPSYLYETARFIAGLKKIDFEEFSCLTSRNTLDIIEKR